MSDCRYVSKRNVALTSLYASDIGSIKSAPISQSFLGNSCLLTVSSYTLSELIQKIFMLSHNAMMFT